MQTNNRQGVLLRLERHLADTRREGGGRGSVRVRGPPHQRGGHEGGGGEEPSHHVDETGC